MFVFVCWLGKTTFARCHIYHFHKAIRILINRRNKCIKLFVLIKIRLLFSLLTVSNHRNHAISIFSSVSTKTLSVSRNMAPQVDKFQFRKLPTYSNIIIFHFVDVIHFYSNYFTKILHNVCKKKINAS